MPSSLVSLETRLPNSFQLSPPRLSDLNMPSSLLGYVVLPRGKSKASRFVKELSTCARGGRRPRLFRRLTQPVRAPLDVVAEFDDVQQVAAGLRRLHRVHGAGVLEHLVAGEAVDRVAELNERALQGVGA